MKVRTMTTIALIAAMPLFGAFAAPDNTQLGGPGTQESGLDAEDMALLASDFPKRITVDPQTGDVSAVEPLDHEEFAIYEGAQNEPESVGPFTAYPNACLQGRPCWHGNPPAISIRFSLGVTTGKWNYVRNFYTGSYYAKLCWIEPGATKQVCMTERNGANALIEIGFPVTGTKVDLKTTRV